nr:MAG TPA: hypothetical protein [Bacteriophage sp.]
MCRIFSISCKFFYYKTDIINIIINISFSSKQLKTASILLTILCNDLKTMRGKIANQKI